MRQYLGGGGRGPWVQSPETTRRPFERADGSVMTNEEIARVATTQQVDVRTIDKPASQSKPLRGRQPVDAELVWATVARLGSQTAAARELKTSQGTIQSALKRYMRDHGLDGPLPGLLTRGQLSERLRVAPSLTAASPASDRQEQSPHTDPAETRPAASDQQVDDDLVPLIAVVHHGDPDARAAAFNEGFDTALSAMRTNRAIDALIDWVTENGPTWSQDDAERWLKAFTATVDLVYPTRVAA